MTVVIPRRESGPLGGKSECPCWTSTKDADGHADLWCPNGHVSLLSYEHHSIATDGTVSPSIVCPRNGCDWHVMGRLDGWVP